MVSGGAPRGAVGRTRERCALARGTQVRTMTEDDPAVEFSRRKVLGGIATVGVAGAGAGAGTWAAWSDDAQSNDNTVTAGEMTLQIDDNEDQSTTLEVSATYPGDSGHQQSSLTNTGDVDGSLSFEVTNVDGYTTDLAEHLLIEIGFGGNAGVSSYADSLEGATHDGPTLASGDSIDLDMWYEVDSEAPNAAQNDEVIFDVAVTLEQ